jgi:hypothetical protein
VTGSCEHCDEYPGSIKYGEFDYLSDYYPCCWFVVVIVIILNNNNNIKSDVIIGTYNTQGKIRNARLYKISAGKPEGKIQFGKPRIGWEDNIKIYIQEIGFENLDWI